MFMCVCIYVCMHALLGQQQTLYQCDKKFVYIYSICVCMYVFRYAYMYVCVYVCFEPTCGSCMPGKISA